MQSKGEGGNDHGYQQQISSIKGKEEGRFQDLIRKQLRKTKQTLVGRGDVKKGKASWRKSRTKIPRQNVDRERRPFKKSSSIFENWGTPVKIREF